ncbi:hypothetical protein [Henriciella aquimarina]|uniref:hypothetical protein n=1 Tax=Henriciella aquimarina TaxID=545261 RepID=UPI000A00E103|nr:hypothetical protein [Henriciella aquimarina]
MKVFIIALLAAMALPFASAAEIDVTYSPEFSKKLQEDYGMREGDRLSEDIREDLEREFGKAKIDPARVSVTIIDAKPNRPTMQQLKDRPGLDMLRSKSIGGMDLEGTAYDANGNVLAELSYDWFETNINQVVASSVWGDADRASRRFAKKFADKLSESAKVSTGPGG